MTASTSSRMLRSLASFGLSPIVQWWRMPNCAARKRSQPISDEK